MKHAGESPENSSDLPRRQVLIGAGAALAAATAWPGPAAAQARKGEIVAGLSERMLTLDPANHYSISATSVLRHIYDPLVEVTNDSKFVPCLAESWTPVNNTTWRFNLRKGVKFHDGTPFTADSVIYSLKRVRDNTKLIKAFVYQDIEDVKKDGDFTVIVSTKKPFGSLPAHLTMLGMLPQTAAANEEAFFQKPVGTGPFKFGGWTHGEQIVLTANADYWKPGIPKVEKVTFRFIPELSTRVAALRAGELHVIDRVWPDNVQTLRSTPGVRVLDTPAIEAQRWIFQLAKEPVKDPRVRQAISLAIDRNVIIKDLLLGYARPVDSPIPPGLIGHTSLPPKAYDPEKARQILKEAGYKNLSHRLRPDEGPLSEAARDRPGGGRDARGRRDHREHQEPRDRHRPRGPERGQLRHVLLGLGPHAPRSRLVPGPVVHEGGRREADPVRQPPHRAADRRGPHAGSQDPPAEVRGDREGPLGGRAARSGRTTASRSTR